MDVVEVYLACIWRELAGEMCIWCVLGGMGGNWRDLAGLVGLVSEYGHV
jgi:hypothetical protein